MAAQIIIRITPKGVERPEIQADSEAEEKAMNEVLERLVPCLDVMTAIVKRTRPGPRG